jgi:hypothetical protein
MFCTYILDNAYIFPCSSGYSDSQTTKIIVHGVSAFGLILFEKCVWLLLWVGLVMVRLTHDYFLT